VRILHLTDRAGERGGAHVHLAGLIEAQAGRHEVRVAAGAREDGLEWPCPIQIVPGLEARTRVAVELDRLVRQWTPDVIHLHTVVNPAVLDWAVGESAVITVQDHRYFCPTRGKWTKQGLVCRQPMDPGPCAGCFDDDAYFREVHAVTAERLAAVRRLRVIVLSHYMRSELIAAGVPEDRIEVIPPFVHGLTLEAEADGPPCVLFAGRLTEAKGVRDAIVAFRLSGVSLPLVFAGTGPLRTEIEAQGFDVLGWLSRTRLSAAYRRARTLLMPSRWQEPFGIAGLEALHFGVPVVAWDSGGIREWHPGEGLVPRGDVPGLARGLRDALDRRSQAPGGFERSILMNRLEMVYETIGGPGLIHGPLVPTAGSCYTSK
jgi:glycosyltransferase involved in cell wall biosynthesis